MKIEQTRYPVNELDRNDKFDDFDDAPRGIRIPHTPRTPEPGEKSGELALLIAVAILGALAVAMTVSSLFR